MWELPLWLRRRAWQPTPVSLPGESPWTQEPGGLQSMGLQRVGHDWVTKHTENVNCKKRKDANMLRKLIKLLWHRIDSNGSSNWLIKGASCEGFWGWDWTPTETPPMSRGRRAKVQRLGLSGKCGPSEHEVYQHSAAPHAIRGQIQCMLSKAILSRED